MINVWFLGIVINEKYHPWRGVVSGGNLEKWKRLFQINPISSRRKSIHLQK